jgi:acetylornithine deacetylase/succinyl-diaminopimelate desuccinylase-like protein
MQGGCEMAVPANEQATIYQRPAELLQNLIRFDTTNPPGNEAQCINYINSLLTQAGIETSILSKAQERPNLIARLKGQGTTLPLLLYGHVDVVTTAHQSWTHPPFEAEMADGYIWGRGALDMKSGVAMMVSAFLRARAEGLIPAGDVILAILSDEEAGSDYGVGFLVENHADWFKGIRYAIGEFGGFPLYRGKKKFYFIQVSEKQICWMQVIVSGPGGHGSLPISGGTMAKLANLIKNLEQHHLPVHITPVAKQMIKTMASALPLPSRLILSQLLNSRLTNIIIRLLGDNGQLFAPLFHNTVSATIVQGGEKVNVIPSEITLYLDGRLLPGYTPENMIAELGKIIGKDIELELVRYDPGPAEPDMGLFDTLAGILREADPDGIPVPLLLSGTSDARFFSRLGIQTYGFTPMNLPENFSFSRTIHSADERIPVESVEFGTQAIYKLLQCFGKQS